MATRGTLADLLARAGLQVSDERPAASPAPSAAIAPAAGDGDIDLASCGKLVLRKERKGRGGKTATVVSGLAPGLREPVARALKRALGCGATVEGEAVVVQGNLAPRAAQWLAAHGARRVVLGT